MVVFPFSHVNTSYFHILSGCLFSMPAGAVICIQTSLIEHFHDKSLPSYYCHKQPRRVIAGHCLGPNWLWMFFGDNLSDCAFFFFSPASVSSMNVGNRELAAWGSLYDRLCQAPTTTQKNARFCSAGSKIGITMPRLETEWRRGERGPDACFFLQQRRENSTRTNLRRQRTGLGKPDATLDWDRPS